MNRLPATALPIFDLAVLLTPLASLGQAPPSGHVGGGFAHLDRSARSGFTNFFQARLHLTH